MGRQTAEHTFGRDSIAAAIERYLAKLPYAVDNREGIAHGWPANKKFESAAIDAALNWLVAAGRLQADTGFKGQRRFRLPAGAGARKRIERPG